MMLIADSGSTKTSWKLIDSMNQIIEVKTSGLNPYFTSAKAIRSSILNEPVLNLNKTNIKAIYFYGSGCGLTEKVSIIKNQLETIFSNAKPFVYSDILGAARALFYNKEGIASILGTGSNTCYYNGENITKSIPSSGYIFGDEGSGSYLGKKLLGYYLNDELPKEIKDKFNSKYKISRADLLTNIYHQPYPNRYMATFCPFIKNNSSNSFIQKMIMHCFDDFFIKQIIRLNKNQSKVIGLVGSIAFNFKEEIIHASKKHNITITDIIENPINQLVNFHTNH